MEDYVDSHTNGKLSASQIEEWTTEIETEIDNSVDELIENDELRVLLRNYYIGQLVRNNYDFGPLKRFIKESVEECENNVLDLIPY